MNLQRRNTELSLSFYLQLMVQWKKQWQTTAKINILANPKCLKLALLGRGQVDPPPLDDECPCAWGGGGGGGVLVLGVHVTHSTLEMHTGTDTLHFDYVIGMHVCHWCNDTSQPIIFSSFFNLVLSVVSMSKCIRHRKEIHRCAWAEHWEHWWPNRSQSRCTTRGGSCQKSLTGATLSLPSLSLWAMEIILWGKSSGGCNLPDKQRWSRFPFWKAEQSPWKAGTGKENC